MKAERVMDVVVAVATMAAMAGAGFVVAGMLTGCGSTGLSVSLMELELLDFGGREQTTMAEGNAEALMEAGGSTVPITDSLNPTLPLVRGAAAGAAAGAAGLEGLDGLRDLLGDGPATPGGAETPPASQGDSPPADAGAESEGSQTFLWKPVSETTGNLVVLLPAALTPAMASGGVVTAGETVLRFASTANGNRTHWRGEAPGASYGGAVTVTAVAANGESWSWSVPAGGDRFEEAWSGAEGAS